MISTIFAWAGTALALVMILGVIVFATFGVAWIVCG